MKIKNKNLSDKSKKWLKRHLTDKYVKLSKDNSYRSRAAFKLIEIIDKYKVLKSVQSVIDLGAAPGSWSEVLVERIKSPKKIIAIDLLHVDPLPGVEIIQGDFTSNKFDTAIVVIDPIDDKRNLAAAISNENIVKFILICRSLKAKPSLKFFKTKMLKKSNKFSKNLLIVKFEFKTRSPDIIWGQIKRATTSLSKQLELEGFTVLRSKSHTDEQKQAYLMFFLESTQISEIYQKKGPEIFRDDSTKSFIAKNLKNTELIWIGNDLKIIALEKRKHTEAVSFMNEFLKKNLNVGIPKGLQGDFKQGFKVFVGNKNLRKSIKEEANELISVDGTFLHFN